MPEGNIQSPRQVLENFTERIQVALQQSLERHNKVSGGGLYQSIKVHTKVYGQKVVLEVIMADYWKFVDKGVSGTITKFNTPFTFKKKNINQSALFKHIANRGIKITPKKGLAFEKQRKTVAFLMGRKIAKFGLKPTHFASDVMDKNSKIIKDLEAELYESVGRQIKITIEQP